MFDIGSKNIIVIGDFMLDHYIYGSINRISPEAPVPVFLMGNENYVVGGAANVVANLIAANQNVTAISMIGDDEYGHRLIRMLENDGCNCEFVFHSSERRTSVKTRLLAQNNQQVVRIDDEEVKFLDFNEEKKILEALEKKLISADVLVISDYMKGVLPYSSCHNVIKMANKFNIPIVVDVKDRNIQKYRNATVIKPNKSELAQMTGLPICDNNDVLEAAKILKKESECEYVLVTLGSQGMLLYGEGCEEWIIGNKKEVYDVSGAGDTAVSYFAAGIANHMTALEATKLANYAAGVKVTKLGTAPVKLSEIKNAGQDQDFVKMYVKSDKVVTIDLLTRVLENRNKKIVFTNGCFDILHFGHVGFLKRAAALGDMLIVGLNSDRSVKKLKGEGRPVNSQEDRAELLAALECVDYVIIFDEDTPLQLIHKIKPNILVKGADYRKEDVVGREFVESYGGRVELLPTLEGHSTTSIIKKIEKDCAYESRTND